MQLFLFFLAVFDLRAFGKNAAVVFPGVEALRGGFWVRFEWLGAFCGKSMCAVGTPFFFASLLLSLGKCVVIDACAGPLLLRVQVRKLPYLRSIDIPSLGGAVSGVKRRPRSIRRCPHCFCLTRLRYVMPTRHTHRQQSGSTFLPSRGSLAT